MSYFKKKIVFQKYIHETEYLAAVLVVIVKLNYPEEYNW